jgi:anti-sigma regulatory factor (Ser/Thr protein kinase)
MVDATHSRFSATDRSYFSILKKDINQIAAEAGFGTQKLADVDLVVSEMSSNLLKYAKNGEILAGLFQEGENCYMELISIDQGPGMPQPQKMMEDGVSSGDTLGMGLGSMKRLSDKFDLYSIKDWGTIILSRIYKSPANPRSGTALQVDLRPLVVTLPGQKVSGDGIYHNLSDQYFKLLVADGLGHGEDANHAVNEAVSAFRSCPFHSPSEIVRFMHTAIRHTRGMVGTVIVFDFKTNSWKISGVGNIGTRLSNFMDVKNQISYNGIIGHNIPVKMDDHEIPLEKFHQITLCSDGIKSQWGDAKLTGINRCDLSIQAAAIYKDYARMTDDMSVVIIKIKK